MSRIKQLDLSRQSIADRVREILMARIVDGTYPAGTRLIEMKIARELDVSQAPIREALCGLEAAGLVDTQPYRGTRVRRISERERREAHTIRAVLEELAARYGAASLREHLAELRAEADATLVAARRGDLQRYLRHNVRFHELVVRSADNEILRRTWQSLSFTVGARVRRSGLSEEMISLAQEHQAIVDTLALGDGRGAGRMLRRHAEVVIQEHDNAGSPSH